MKNKIPSNLGAPAKAPHVPDYYIKADLVLEQFKEQVIKEIFECVEKITDKTWHGRVCSGYNVFVDLFIRESEYSHKEQVYSKMFTVISGKDPAYDTEEGNRFYRYSNIKKVQQEREKECGGHKDLFDTELCTQYFDVETLIDVLRVVKEDEARRYNRVDFIL